MFTPSLSRAVLTGAALLALSCAGAPALRALQATPAPRVLDGRVEHGQRGVGAVEVTLHRVTADSSGVVGRTRTDAAGRFSFALPAVTDTLAFSVYFATVDYLDTRYFGRPLHRGEGAGDYAIAVYDTSSAPGVAGQVRLARRDVVMIPGTDGGWEVNEVLQIVNPTGVTLVPRDGISTWEFRIPEDVTSFQAGEGELGADDVARMEDRVILRQPLVPGTRELFLRYQLPRDYAPGAISLDTPADTVNVFIRQPSPEITVTGAVNNDVVVAEGERFVQYGALDVGPEKAMEVRWAATAPSFVDPVVAAVALTTLVLAVGTWAAVRNRAGQPARARVGPAAAPRHGARGG